MIVYLYIASDVNYLDELEPAIDEVAGAGWALLQTRTIRRGLIEFKLGLPDDIDFPALADAIDGETGGRNLLIQAS